MKIASRCITTLLGAIVLAAASAGAFAQAYPTKPVTIIVPWPPGGPSDIAARPMAKLLSEEMKQTFIIDNRGGAGGNIGSAMVAKAAPDGYTLLITSSAPIVINPSLYKQMPFDPPKDLAPITNLLRVPLILAVHPSIPAKNLQELHRLRQFAERQGPVRVVRQRHAAASDRRAVQGDRKARHDPRAVQGLGARHHRPHRRSCARSCSTARLRSCRTSRPAR